MDMIELRINHTVTANESHIISTVRDLDEKRRRRKTKILALLDDEDVQTKIVKIIADNLTGRGQLHTEVTRLLG